MDKLAAIANKRAQINALVVSHISRYASLNEALDELISAPSEGTASDVDSVFAAIGTDLSQLQNAITTLANMLVKEDGEIEEIDAVEEEDGMRLL